MRFIMKSRTDRALMKQILDCKKCTQSNNVKKCIPNHSPVCCFGDPFDKNGDAKKVFVIGINPSEAEYTSGYLENDPERALESQLSYFDREPYRFFNELARFFDDIEVKARLNAERSIWDRVGCLDLVKCVTRAAKGKQWNDLRPSEKNTIQKNCERFLKEQLSRYKPKLAVAYGKDVGKWFGIQGSESEEFDFISNPRKLPFEYHAIYVPQRQGKHSRPEVNEVKAKIREALSSI
jgi:hypothetical protein